MAEYADKYNSRLILVNRRGYPGSDPFTDEERNLLFSKGKPYDVVNANMQIWMSHRAVEIYDFLSLLIQNENIPPYDPSTHTGGISLSGWSLGCGFLTGFLANTDKFPRGPKEEVNVKRYLRRLILYGICVSLK